MTRFIGTKWLPVLVLFIIWSPRANADIIYNAGATTDNSDGTNAACTGTQCFNSWPEDHSLHAASTFVLSAGASTITSAEWWGVCGPPGCTASQNFTVSIFTDSSGLPGTLVASYDVGSANQTATSFLVSNISPVYVYSAAFAPVVLTAGQTYWLALSDASGATGVWAWNTVFANPSDEAGTCAADVNGSWGVSCTSGFPEHNSFQLFGLTNSSTTPEPASYLLSVFGLVGLTILARFVTRPTPLSDGYRRCWPQGQFDESSKADC